MRSGGYAKQAQNTPLNPASGRNLKAKIFSGSTKVGNLAKIPTSSGILTYSPTRIKAHVAFCSLFREIGSTFVKTVTYGYKNLFNLEKESSRFFISPNVLGQIWGVLHPGFTIERVSDHPGTFPENIIFLKHLHLKAEGNPNKNYFFFHR